MTTPVCEENPGLAERRQDGTVLGDGTYVNAGFLVPHRWKSGEGLALTAEAVLVAVPHCATFALSITAHAR
ncbi:hypothetical protein ACFCW6_06730 [Streptomyces sp. NPDC056333]|uniref:hypothetical protein n=1 Tax=Streptomyces sp. NPDC056333 TaxID=3345786 RepID=UPI0035D9355E